MDIYVKLKSSAAQAKKALDEVRKSTSKLGRETKTTNAGMAAFYSQLKKTNSKFTNISKDVNRASASITGFGKALKGVAGIAGVYTMVNALKTAIQSAMDMVETQNLFNISLKQNAASASAFLEKMSAASGMDLTNLKSATGTFALLARSMGMTGDQAERLSTTSTQLAVDLASAVNVPVSQALQDIKSGLIGQTETMYKYGVDLTEAALKQEALAEGITKSVRQMSQGEKMALRYNLMLKQTSIVHGDFARTIEAPANQMKVLSERLVTAGRAIGTIFLPAIQMILPYANAALIVVTKLANAIATLFGYDEKKMGVTGVDAISEDADIAAGNIDDTTSALKKLKDTTLGFDELNSIQSATDSAGDAAVGAAAIQGMDLSTYDSGLAGLVSKADGYAQTIMDAFTKKDWTLVGTTIGNGINKFVDYLNLSGVFPKIDAFGEEVRVALGGIINSAVATIEWDSLGSTIGTGINTALNFVITSVSSINFVGLGSSIAAFFNNAISTIDWTKAGEYITLGFRIALDFASGFVKTFSFTNLGLAIADFINGAFASIDWAKFGKTLSNGVSGVLTTIRTALQNVNWNQIGEDVRVFLSNIDWKGIFGQVGEIIGESLGAIFEFAGGGISLTPMTDELVGLGMALGGIYLWVKGGAIAEGLANFAVTLAGLGTKIPLIGGVFTWLSETVLGIGSSFQIVGATLGGWILPIIAVIALVAAAITELWNTNADFRNSITEAWESIKNLFNVIWEDGLKPIFNSIVDMFKQIWNEGVLPLWDGFKDFVEGFVTAFSEVLKTVVDNVTPIVQKILPTFTGAFKTVSSVVGAVISTVLDVIGSLLSGFNNIFVGIGDILKGIINFLVGVFTADWKKAWSGLGSIVSGIMNIVLGVVESLVNGVISGVNFLIKMVNSLINKIPSSIRVALGIDLLDDIKKIELPRVQLARGGSLQAGTLFEAGENGKAEMIGNYKGNTTVMPLENTDFVQAMYEAVASAMRDNNQESGGTVIENVVNIDGEVMYRNQKKVEQRRGNNFGLGAFAR